MYCFFIHHVLTYPTWNASKSDDLIILLLSFIFHILSFEHKKAFLKVFGFHVGMVAGT